MWAIVRTYAKARLGEPTTIAGIAVIIGATVAYLTGSLTLALYEAALGGAVTLIISPQKPTPVQGPQGNNRTIVPLLTLPVSEVVATPMQKTIAVTDIPHVVVTHDDTTVPIAAPPPAAV